MNVTDDIEEEELLRVFHEKASKCTNKRQMRAFCYSFIRKYGDDDAYVPSIMPTYSSMPALPIKTEWATHSVDGYIRVARGSDYPRYEMEVKADMVRHLADQLLKNGYIKFEQENECMTARTTYKASIKVAT